MLAESPKPDAGFGSGLGMQPARSALMPSATPLPPPLHIEHKSLGACTMPTAFLCTDVAKNKVGISKETTGLLLFPAGF